MAKMKLRAKKVSSVKALKSSLKKNSGAAFMKRVPGDDSLNVRFLTEPDEWYEYHEYFTEKDKFFPATEGMDPDVVRELGNPSKRFLCQAVDIDENAVIPLVLPKSLAQSLMKKYDKYQTLMDRDYELVREGTGFDTTYEAIPEAPTKFNARKFELIDLLEVLEAQVPKDDDEDDEDDLDDDLLDDDDDDDDDVPIRRTARQTKRPAKESARKPRKRLSR